MRTILILILLILTCNLFSQENIIGTWMITTIDYIEYDTVNVKETDEISDSNNQVQALSSSFTTTIPLLILNDGNIIIIGEYNYYGSWKLHNSDTFRLNIAEECFYGIIKDNNLLIDKLDRDSVINYIAIKLPKSKLWEELDIEKRAIFFDAGYLGDYRVTFLDHSKIQFSNREQKSEGSWEYKYINNSYFLILRLDFNVFVFYVFDQNAAGYKSIMFSPGFHIKDELMEIELIMIDNKTGHNSK